MVAPPDLEKFDELVLENDSDSVKVRSVSYPYSCTPLD